MICFIFNDLLSVLFLFETALNYWYNRKAYRRSLYLIRWSKTGLLFMCSNFLIVRIKPAKSVPHFSFPHFQSTLEFQNGSTVRRPRLNIGERAFSVAASRVWNHLYRQSWNCIDQPHRSSANWKRFCYFIIRSIWKELCYAPSVNLFGA